MSDFPELIADRARPPVGRPADGRLALALGEKRACGLDELARAHGTTRFAILLTAYRLLIGRSTGTRDVTIVAGPPGGDLYPTRETWDDGATFAALLDGAPGEPDAADIAGPGAVVFAAGGP